MLLSKLFETYSGTHLFLLIDMQQLNNTNVSTT